MPYRTMPIESKQLDLSINDVIKLILKQPMEKFSRSVVVFPYAGENVSALIINLNGVNISIISYYHIYLAYQDASGEYINVPEISWWNCFRLECLYYKFMATENKIENTRKALELQKTKKEFLNKVGGLR